MRLTQMILLGVLFCPYLLLAQSASRITGRVLDKTNGNPLEGATISILSKESGKFITHTVSKKDGNFSVGGLSPEIEIELFVSYSGYKDTSAVFTIPTKKTMTTGDWKLGISTDELEEVTVVSRKPPFIVKNDTLEFNADAFKSLPNDMVQDLLRKLPGLIMDENGNVTINGRKVNRIKVDGRDFFNGNLKMASENLPGAIIDKIQVYDTKERGEENTSIIQRRKKDVTLNLTLKKNSKRGVFGHLGGGYGTKDRYKTNIFLNSFEQGKMMSLFGATGNIEGIQGLRVMDGDANPDMGSAGIVKSNTGLGVNFNDEIGKKGRLDFSYMANMSNRENNTIVDRTNILPDSSFLYNSNTKSNSIIQSHNINGGYTVELDTLQSFSIRPNINYNHNIADAFANARSTTTKGDNINSQQNRNRNSENSFGISNVFTYSRTSADHKTTLSLNWNINYQQGRGSQINHSKNTFYNNNLIIEDSLDQSGTTNNNGISNNATLNIYRHLSKRIVSIVNYSFIQNDNRSDKDVFNFNNTSGKHDLLDSTYSIHNKNTGITHLPTASIGYKGDKFSAELGAGVRFIRQNNRIIWKDSTIKVEQQNFSPRADFSYRFNTNSQITAGYTVNANQPSPDQLAPVQDNTNPLYIRLGNPFLRSEIIHQFNTNINYFSSDYKWQASLSGTGSINKNAMVENSYYDSIGRTISTYQNVNGVNQFGGALSLSSMLRFNEWSLTFGFSSGISTGNSIGFMNLKQNNSRMTQLNSQVNASINYKSGFFLLVNAGFDINKTSYSLNGLEDINYNLKRIMVISKWTPIKRFTLKTSMVYSYNSQLPADFQRSKTLINSSLSYNFLKNERLTFEVGVVDMLNNNVNVSRMVTPVSIEVSQVNALRRYGMLTINYRISKFGGLN